MTISDILIIAILIFLFLIYSKLNNLLEYSENRQVAEDEKEHGTDFSKLEGNQKEVSGKLSKLVDILETDTPLWGKESFGDRKKINLTKLYTQYLIEVEKISKDDANRKAGFVVNNFQNDLLVSEINESLEINEKHRAEKAFRESELFVKAVNKKSKELKNEELYEPLYFFIKEKYVHSHLYQRDERAFNSYSTESGYENFVRDAAIILRLEQLGIIKKEHGWEERGLYFYSLIEYDLAKIREIIFGNNPEDNESFDDDYFKARCSDKETACISDNNIPFQFI